MLAADLMARVAGRVALSAAAVVGDADLAVISETIWYVKPRLSCYMLNLQFPCKMQFTI